MGKEAETVKIGSIGSNINEAQMLRRVGKFKTVGPAWLRDFTLGFDKPDSRRPGHGAANVRPQKGKNVLCLVQELSLEQALELDEYERGYTRKPHEVNYLNGATGVIDIFVATITVPGLTPAQDYLDIVLSGVRAVFPREYEYDKEILKAAQATLPPSNML